MSRTSDLVMVAILASGLTYGLLNYAHLLAGNLNSPARTEKAPTATEVFRLRSECATLAEQIMEDNLVGIALHQSQTSHYDPETNRCYVLLTVQNADLSLPLEKTQIEQFLFDGQTKEMLASTKIKGSPADEKNKSGMVFDQQHQTTTLNNAGWNDADTYINNMMKDDRKNR